MSEQKTDKITWSKVINAVIQAVIAALTALGVSSCVGLSGGLVV